MLPFVHNFYNQHEGQMNRSAINGRHKLIKVYENIKFDIDLYFFSFSLWINKSRTFKVTFFLIFILCNFFQSDIVHQSVYELVHSEDREELQRQLLWNSFLPQDLTGMPLSEALAPDKSNYLERSFTVRFRCLLDNTSGFLVRLNSF